MINLWSISYTLLFKLGIGVLRMPPLTVIHHAPQVTTAHQEPPTPHSIHVLLGITTRMKGSRLWRIVSLALQVSETTFLWKFVIISM